MGYGNVCMIRWEMVVCGANGPWKNFLLVLSDIITIWTEWVCWKVVGVWRGTEGRGGRCVRFACCFIRSSDSIVRVMGVDIGEWGGVIGSEPYVVVVVVRVGCIDLV